MTETKEYTVGNPPPRFTSRDKKMRKLNKWYAAQENVIYENYLKDLNRDMPRRMKAEADLMADYSKKIAVIEKEFWDACRAND